MDLIGHCLTIEKSNIFEVEEIYSPKITEFMFVNIMHCHDWGYRNCWKLDRFKPSLQESVKCIRAHLVCDWVVHYGSNQTNEKLQIGWVYSQIHRITDLASAYFRELRVLGYLGDKFGDVCEWSPRKKMNILHSLIEYAIDLRLGEDFDQNKFEAIKKGLLLLQNETGYGSRGWIKKLFEELDVKSDREEDYLDHSINEMIDDAAQASFPGEFAVRTTLHKANIKPNAQTLSVTRKYLEKIASVFSEDEINQIVSDVGKAIYNPEQFYTGPLSTYNDSPSL